jgi:hypothetical protein
LKCASDAKDGQHAKYRQCDADFGMREAEQSQRAQAIGTVADQNDDAAIELIGHMSGKQHQAKKWQKLR